MQNKFSDQELEEWSKSPQRIRLTALRGCILDIVNASKDHGITFPEVITALSGVMMIVCLEMGVSLKDFEKSVEMMNTSYKEMLEEKDGK